VREVVRSEVERLEREHLDAVVDGGALRRAEGGPGGVRGAHGARCVGRRLTWAVRERGGRSAVSGGVAVAVAVAVRGR
jgi:hypothetical protein